MKNYPPTCCLNGYANIVIFCSGFFASQKKEDENRVRMRYRKAVGEGKDIESDFYGNDSPNDDLESEI